jgi:hypothetical protein
MTEDKPPEKEEKKGKKEKKKKVQSNLKSPKQLAKLAKQEKVVAKKQAQIAKSKALEEAHRVSSARLESAKENLKQAKKKSKGKGLDVADKINAKTEIIRAEKRLAEAVKDARERKKSAMSAGKVSSIGLSKDLKKERDKRVKEVKKIDKELKKSTHRFKGKIIDAMIEQEQATKVTITSKCPECHWVLSSSATKCPRCGWIKPIEEEEVVKVIPEPLGPSLEEMEAEEEVKLFERKMEEDFIQEKIEKANKEIAETHKRIEVINEEFYAKTISQEEYMEQKTKLYEKLGELQAKLTMLNQ